MGIINQIILHKQCYNWWCEKPGPWPPWYYSRIFRPFPASPGFSTSRVYQGVALHLFLFTWSYDCLIFHTWWEQQAQRRYVDVRSTSCILDWTGALNIWHGKQTMVIWGNLCVCRLVNLTSLPPDKMASISQTIFSDVFLWMKSVFWLKFHWKLLLTVWSNW